MKYLSFITVLILLVTLFSFVFSQLNKDETKRHEYGIAFPLEESESRLPSLGSILPLSGDGLKETESDSGQELTTTPPTTTTTAASSLRKVAVGQSKQPGRSRTIAVASVSEDENNSSEEQYGEKETIPILLQSLVESAMQNESMKDGASVEIDEDEEDEDSGDGPTIINSSLLNPTASGNPKLVFIERLMGLNFQRPTSSADDFSSFLELNNDSSDSDKTSPSGASVSLTATAVSTSESNKTDESADSDKDSDSIWGTNSLENLRSKWESRIRKFTLPFQNTYSVVLRASNGLDSSSSSSGGISGSTEAESPDSSDEQLEISPASSSMPGRQSSTSKQDSPISSAKFFISASSGLNPQRSATEQSELENSAQQSQTSQLLRMAALSMMSKLFSAIRSQELEDDDESENGESDGSERASSMMEPIPVPIIIAQKPRMSSIMAEMMSREGGSPYSAGPGSYASYPGYQRDSRVYASDESPIRTTIMYGRPANPMSMSMSSSGHGHQSAHDQQLQQFASPSRFYASHQQPPMSPIGAILSAAIQAAAASSSNSPSSSMYSASSARPSYYRRFESGPSMASPMEMSPSGQPQRIILLITHRPSASESQPQIQMIQREEPSYSHSMQPNFVQYSPLSVPSSPVYYQYQHPSSSSSSESSRAHPTASIQIRPQVVEVPVPVYLPMHSRASPIESAVPVVSGRSVMSEHSHHRPTTMIIKSVSSSTGSVPAATAAITLPRSAVPIHSTVDYPHHHHHHHHQYSSGPQQQQQLQSQSGHVALVYYHSPESKESGVESNSDISQPQAQMSMDVAQHIAPSPASVSQSSSSDDSDSTTGIVRIMLRPRHSPMGIPLGMSSPLSMASRLAYHRRIDAEQQSAANAAEEESDDQTNNSEDFQSPVAALSTSSILSELLGGNLGISETTRDSSRLRQWRDYSQSSRAEQQQQRESPFIFGGSSGSAGAGSMQASSSSAPMAHIFIAASSARNPEPEPEQSESSEEHHYVHQYHPVASGALGQPQPSVQQFHHHQQQQQPQQVSPMSSSHYYSNLVPSSFSSSYAPSSESDASPMQQQQQSQRDYYHNHQQHFQQQAQQHQAPVVPQQQHQQQQQQHPQSQQSQSHFFLAQHQSPVYQPHHLHQRHQQQQAQQPQLQAQQQQQSHQFLPPQHHFPSQYQAQVSATSSQINVDSSSQSSPSSSGSLSGSESVSVSVPAQPQQPPHQQSPVVTSGHSATFLIMSPDPNSSGSVSSSLEQSNSSNDS